MKHYEDQEQIAVVQWASLYCVPNTKHRISDYLIAVPNEGRRSPRSGNKFRKLGMKAGVSDLFLAYPQNSIHGLWIEMKKQRQHFESERQADNAETVIQKVWRDRMESIGYMGRVCYGADHAIHTICIYLGLKV